MLHHMTFMNLKGLKDESGLYISDVAKGKVFWIIIKSFREKAISKLLLVPPSPKLHRLICMHSKFLEQMFFDKHLLLLLVLSSLTRTNGASYDIHALNTWMLNLGNKFHMFGGGCIVQKRCHVMVISNFFFWFYLEQTQ